VILVRQDLISINFLCHKSQHHIFTIFFPARTSPSVTAPFTAPELIDNAKKTTESDVYSFAMVMVEFTLPECSHPWEGEMVSCDLIYYHVRKGNRPSIDLEKMKDLTANDQDKCLSLLEKCRSQCLDDRPSMVEVCEKLDDVELHGRNKNCMVMSDKWNGSY